MIVTIVLLFVLSGIAILRAFESRNEWRKYIMEQGIDEELK